MIVREAIWSAICDNFSEEEKILLRECVVGNIICPASTCIDINKLPDSLERKLVDLVVGAKEAKHASVK